MLVIVIGMPDVHRLPLKYVSYTNRVHDSETYHILEHDVNETINQFLIPQLFTA